MDLSSNWNETGKLGGYSNGNNINTIPEIYTAADNDEFMHEIIEDYSTFGDKTLANPSGIIFTKFNGERATRRFA
jgi:hypothetical protein